MNSGEAECVRLVFRLAEQGFKGQHIADELNQSGFVLRNGKPWTQRQVSRILKKERLYREGSIRYGEIEGEMENRLILADYMKEEVPLQGARS